MDEGLKQVEVGMDLAVRKVGLDAVLQMVEHYMPQVEEGEGALLKGTQYIIDLRLVRSRLESRLLLDKVLVQMEMWPAVEMWSCGVCSPCQAHSSLAKWFDLGRGREVENIIACSSMSEEGKIRMVLVREKAHMLKDKAARWEAYCNKQ